MKTILSIICIIIAYVSFCSCTTTYSVSKQNDYTLKSATIIQYTIKGRFMSR